MEPPSSRNITVLNESERIVRKSHLQRAMAFALAWTAGAILVGHLRSIFGPLATLALGGPLACSICLGAAMLLVPACRLAPVLARFKDIVGQHPMRAGMPALPTAPE